jgi:hypothetical protein
MSQFPNFTEASACAGDSNPDAWFPEEVPDPSHEDRLIELSDTPEALRAKGLCMTCPAYDECMNYSMQFKDLTGIWAGLDVQERRELQEYKRVPRKTLKNSYVHYEVNRMIIEETGYDAWWRQTS